MDHFDKMLGLTDVDDVGGENIQADCRDSAGGEAFLLHFCLGFLTFLAFLIFLWLLCAS